MDIDTQLRERIARELAGSDAPPLGSMVADAAAAGASRRRLQRYGIIGGSLAGIAAFAIVGALIAGGAPTPNPLQAGSAGAGPTPAAAPSYAPPPPGSPDGNPPTHPPYPGQTTTGQAVVALMTTLMPFPGTLSQIDFGKSPGWANGTFLYQDGKGPATVSASVSDEPVQFDPTVPVMKCPPDTPGFTCTARNLPHGSKALLMTVGPFPGCSDAKCSIIEYRVELERADGIYVIVEASNGPEGRDQLPTRAKPILTMDQVIAFATDPRWSLKMDKSFVAQAGRTIHAR